MALYPTQRAHAPQPGSRVGPRWPVRPLAVGIVPLLAQAAIGGVELGGGMAGFVMDVVALIRGLSGMVEMHEAGEVAYRSEQ
jgi:hypothetical protein